MATESNAQLVSQPTRISRALRGFSWGLATGLLAGAVSGLFTMGVSALVELIADRNPYSSASEQKMCGR